MALLLNNSCSVVSVPSHISLCKAEITNLVKDFFGGECLKKKIIGFATLLALSMLLSVPSVLAVVVDNSGNGPPSHVNDGTVGMIQVTSYGTIWYTIVPKNPIVYNGHNGGSFQQLDPTTTPASTPYGPGDVGYRGGRWWVDVNGNGVMDPEGPETGGDHYFLCPLTHKAPGT